METALRRMGETVQAFADAARAWFASGAWRPETWPPVTWVLVGALTVLVALAIWRWRRRPRPAHLPSPRLLVTHGEVVPDGVAEAANGVRRGRRRLEPIVHAPAGSLAITVSNLGRTPVQLLEVALRDDRRGAPRVADVDAVLPALGSVVVEGRVPLGLRGDGWLDVYVAVAAPRVRFFRHRVALVWEPWSARFKAALHEQTSQPARRAASDEPRARFLEDVASTPFGFGEPAPVRGEVAAADAPRAARFADGVPASQVAPPARSGERASGAAVAAAAQEAPSAVSAADAVSPPIAVSRAPTPPSDRGVPRIATPPVGVAIAGRGGAAAVTPDGVPIGRPAGRAEPASEPPVAPESARHDAADVTPRPVPVRVDAADVTLRPVPGRVDAAAAPSSELGDASPEAVPGKLREPAAAAAAPAAPTDEDPAEAPPADAEPPPGEAPVTPRRRPHLEFPDEF